MPANSANQHDLLKRLDQRLARIEKESTSDRVWDIATKAMVPVGMAVCGFLINLAVRVSIIESNRFTDGDAAELRRQMMLEIPPKWLQEDLKEIKDRLRDVERKLNSK